jgi:hypothetical protein
MSRAGFLAQFKPQQEALALLKYFGDDPRNEVRSLSGIPVKGVCQWRPRRDRRGCAWRGHHCVTQVFYQDEGNQRVSRGSRQS